MSRILTPKQADAEIEQFYRIRNEALLSMDERKIREFWFRNTGHHGPEDSEVFWRAVHKARTGIPGLPLNERRKSKAWLEERGSETFDDGDLA